MTSNDGYLILLESLQQTDNSKGAFFLGKAKEINIVPGTLFLDLYNLFKDLETYVNTIDRTVWGIDDEGNREDLFNNINLISFTNGIYKGTLDKENIWQFLPGLEQFGQMILIEMNEKLFTKRNDLINVLNTISDSNSIAESIPRLKTNLNTDQISNLFKLLKKGEFIPTDTDPDSFKWSFGDPEQSRPEHFVPVTWNEAKHGLRELLTPFLGTITNQHKRDIQQLFLKNGEPFAMSRPKKDEYSASYTKIKEIVNSLNLKKIPDQPDQH